MHRLRLLSVALAVWCCGVSVPAQTGGDAAWSERFHQPGLLNRVFGLGTYGGELIAGGQEFEAQGRFLSHIARYDGSEWQPMGGGVNGRVRAITNFRGDLIAGGEFGLAGGRIVRGVARWDGSQWHPLGSGLLNSQRPYGAEVFALAVYRDQLYVGGYLDSAGGVRSVGIARWDGSQWYAVGGAGVGNAFEAKVLSLHVYNDRLYVGGEFGSAGGVAATNVAVWDGSRFAALGSGVGAAIGDGVHALASYQGEIYAGGVFGRAGSVTTRKIARWNGNAWRPVGNGVADWAISTSVSSLHVHDGSLFVGGNFIEVDATATGSGVLARAVARWDGTAWHGFGGIEGSDLATTAIALTSWDGKLVIGGEFKYGGTPLRVGSAVSSWGVIAYDGSDWHPLGRGLAAGGTKLVHWNGGIVSVGGFITAGTVLSPRVALFDGTDWRTLGEFRGGNAKDAVVWNGELVVCGTFTHVDGRSVGSVVRYDGRNWIDMGYGGTVLAVHNGSLYAGGLGAVQRWTGSSWTRLPTIFGNVEVMESYAGELYIGGGIAAGGTRENLYRWNGSTLRSVGGGTDDTVESMLVRNGRLVLGGRFTSAGGTVASHIATWDGGSFRQLGPGVGGTVVSSLAEMGGSLFVGGHIGDFWNSNPKWTARFDGTSFQPLGSDLDGIAFSLLPVPESGELWIAGGFTEAGGKPSRGIAVWHDKPRWDDLGGGLPGAGTVPVLRGYGALRRGETLRFAATGIGAGRPALWVFGAGLAQVPLPVGGTLVPRPDVSFTAATDALGNSILDLRLPSAVPAGTTLAAQTWSLDAASGTVLGTNGVARTR